MFLIVYVDDMKLAGPAEHMALMWEKLGKGIQLEKPKGDGIDKVTGVHTHTFLGCEHTTYDKVVAGKTVRCMKWDVCCAMKTRLQSKVSRACCLEPMTLRHLWFMMKPSTQRVDHRTLLMIS